MIKKNLKITEITVTPENVDEHVDKCKSNRNRSRKHINTWKRALKKGHFREGGFIFADEKGFYDDGQHRLVAVKEMGATTTFYLVSGLSREALNMMIDAGKKRTNQDRLKAIKDVKYANVVCPAIEQIIHITDVTSRDTAMLLPDEVLSFYHENRKELEALAQAYFKRIPEISAQLLVALQFIFTRINEQKSDQFFSSLTSRHLLKSGDPVFAFYEMLKNDKVTTCQNRGVIGRYIRNGLLIAWNAHLKGESLEKIEPNERYITIEGTAVFTQPEPENGDGGIEMEQSESDSEADDESSETE